MPTVTLLTVEPLVLPVIPPALPAKCQIRIYVLLAIFRDLLLISTALTSSAMLPAQLHLTPSLQTSLASIVPVRAQLAQAPLALNANHV